MIFEENKVKETYLDKYEGLHSEISQVTRFDENTDVTPQGPGPHHCET